MRRRAHEHEQYVDWEALETIVASGGKAAAAMWRGEVTRVIADIGGQLDALVDLAQLGELRPLLSDEFDVSFTSLLTGVALKAGTAAVTEARNQDVAVSVPSEVAAVMIMRGRARATQEMLGLHVVNTAQADALRRSQAAITPALRHDVLAYLRGLTWQWPADQLGGAVAAAANWGRIHTLAPADEIRASAAPGQPVTWYASELLDRNTCKPCARVDGADYLSLTAALRDYPAGGFKDCDGRARCRGTLVAVYR